MNYLGRIDFIVITQSLILFHGNQFLNHIAHAQMVHLDIYNRENEIYNKSESIILRE